MSVVFVLVLFSGEREEVLVIEPMLTFDLNDDYLRKEPRCLNDFDLALTGAKKRRGESGDVYA